MTRFAADVLRILPLRFQPCMRRCLEVARDRFVAGRAFLRADEFRAWDARRRHDGVIRFEAAARKQNDSERRTAADNPPQLFALPHEPTSDSRELHWPQSCRNRSEVSPHFYR